MTKLAGAFTSTRRRRLPQCGNTNIERQIEVAVRFGSTAAGDRRKNQRRKNYRMVKKTGVKRVHP
uniref:Uncharacterized protein n=1 Tax=Oryza nivara TaxID=4536 RepID=A0A0E0FZZ9_ORYNI